MKHPVYFNHIVPRDRRRYSLLFRWGKLKGTRAFFLPTHRKKKSILKRRTCKTEITPGREEGEEEPKGGERNNEVGEGNRELSGKEDVLKSERGRE